MLGSVLAYRIVLAEGRRKGAPSFFVWIFIGGGILDIELFAVLSIYFANISIPFLILSIYFLDISIFFTFL
jgi:hypothetical protein